MIELVDVTKYHDNDDCYTLAISKMLLAKKINDWFMKD